MEKYITFGTNIISKELFKDIIPFNTKPYGGLWLTKYDDVNSNEWLMYLEEHPSIFFMKFNSKACIVTLNENVNIFQINTINEFENAYKLFPSPYYDKKILDYNKISEDYDGIYINNAIINKIGYEDFCISSLILFNITSIKSYMPVYVDYYKHDYYIDYEITKYEKEKLINYNECEKFYCLYNNIKNDFFEVFTPDIFVNLDINSYFNYLINMVSNYVEAYLKIHDDLIKDILLHENFKGKTLKDIENAFTHKLYYDVFYTNKPLERKKL